MSGQNKEFGEAKMKTVKQDAIRIGIGLLAIAGLTAFIWSRSGQSSAASHEESGRLLALLAGFLNTLGIRDPEIQSFLIRKAAHFSEFAALGAAVFGTVRHTALRPHISAGWAAFYGLDAKVIPLREDFSLSVDDYMDFDGTIFIANPNAPTGMTISNADIRRLLEKDPNRVVVIDEAYVDFGGESCVPMTAEYDNLLVVQTFSKSRALAGGRVGFGIGCKELIADLNRIKYSFNPYNINRLSILAGAAAMADEAYFEQCCKAVQEARSWTTAQLEQRGFTVLPSKANFVFAKSDRISGNDLYRKLKANGILVRWFDSDRIRDFARITIGSMEQMQALVNVVDRLLEEV